MSAIVFALISSYPVLVAPNNWGIQDWDQHLFYHYVPRQAVVDYHELPLWNPYACGGMALFANPQSRVLTPFFLLHLLLGTALALRLEIVLHIALAFAGAYLLAHRTGLQVLGACLAGSVFAFSGYFAVNLMVGMTVFLPVAYLPFVVLLLERGIEHRVNVWGVAALLTLIIGEGGHYVLPIAMMAAAVHTLLRLRELGFWLAVRRMTELVAVTVGLSAVKLLPMAELMARFPRHTDEYSGFSLHSLAYSLLSRQQSVDALTNASRVAGLIDGFSYGIDENGVYIGAVTAVLGLVGIASQVRRRAWRWPAMFGVFLWLSFGDRMPVSLWSVLHRLPGFDSMRVAQRFRMMWLLIAALLAAAGLEAVRAWLARRSGRPRASTALAAALVALASLDMVSMGLPLWRDAFPITPWVTGQPGEFTQVVTYTGYDSRGPVDAQLVRSAWGGYMPAYMLNHGTVNCYERIPVVRAAIPDRSPDYRGEAHVEDTSGTARVAGRTPNTVRIAAHLEGPGVVVVNQNYFTGWRASTGDVMSRDDLLAIRLGPGDHDLRLSFAPASVWLGAMVTAMTVAIGCWLASSRR